MGSLRPLFWDVKGPYLLFSCHTLGHNLRLQEREKPPARHGSESRCDGNARIRMRKSEKHKGVVSPGCQWHNGMYRRQPYHVRGVIFGATLRNCYLRDSSLLSNCVLDKRGASQACDVTRGPTATSRLGAPQKTARTTCTMLVAAIVCSLSPKGDRSTTDQVNGSMVAFS